MHYIHKPDYIKCDKEYGEGICWRKPLNKCPLKKCSHAYNNHRSELFALINTYGFSSVQHNIWSYLREITSLSTNYTEPFCERNLEPLYLDTSFLSSDYTHARRFICTGYITDEGIIHRITDEKLVQKLEWLVEREIEKCSDVKKLIKTAYIQNDTVVFPIENEVEWIYREYVGNDWHHKQSLEKGEVDYSKFIEFLIRFINDELLDKFIYRYLDVWVEYAVLLNSITEHMQVLLAHPDTIYDDSLFKLFDGAFHYNDIRWDDNYKNYRRTMSPQQAFECYFIDYMGVNPDNLNSEEKGKFKDGLMDTLRRVVMDNLSRKGIVGIRDINKKLSKKRLPIWHRLDLIISEVNRLGTVPTYSG